ncbi:MAG TPA: hypothetical protein VGS05_09845 [Candidatus Sulfotelmatobacter sp.]|nr:hypothetical protein [Candidatus Sulfotelmatobacter sp.]
MSLQRVPDWRFRLGQIIESARQLEFEWGVFDCALHACNCIRAITGTDPAANYRGKYSDEAGAAEIYGASFEFFIASTAANLGLPEIPVTLAQRGDLVFLDNETAQGAIGVVSLDARFASCAGSKGLVLVRIHRWKRAWRVG